MTRISNKLSLWQDESTGQEGLNYWCQGCESHHTIITRGPGAWGWNGDAVQPVFSPSVLVTYPSVPDASERFAKWRAERRCHSYVGSNGALPGQVIFLGDSTHHLVGKIVELPDLPDWID